jgi:hypothetical protein
MAASLTPDRSLATTVGVDEDDHLITLWRTEWTLRAELVDATPWVRSPRQAIRLADEMDDGYQRVLQLTA